MRLAGRTRGLTALQLVRRASTGAICMPRRAGTYDASSAAPSRTSAVTANVHGSTERGSARVLPPVGDRVHGASVNAPASIVREERATTLSGYPVNAAS